MVGREGKEEEERERKGDKSVCGVERRQTRGRWNERGEERMRKWGRGRENGRGKGRGRQQRKESKARERKREGSTINFSLYVEL